MSALGAEGCVREHTLFHDNGSGGDGSGGSPSGTVPEPWTQDTCVAALSQGQTGDACVGPFNCSATSQCCKTEAACKVDSLVLTTSCDDCVSACTVDSDCDKGTLCDGYQCRACPNEVCPTTWSTIVRNGCSVCVPPNRCGSSPGSASCDTGEVCVAGLSCLSSCKADPACCFGNQCSDPACPSLEGADCLTVGCAPGFTCKVVGDAVGCKCDPQLGKWVCESPPQNVCVPR